MSLNERRNLRQGRGKEGENRMGGKRETRKEEEIGRRRGTGAEYERAQTSIQKLYKDCTKISVYKNFLYSFVQVFVHTCSHP